MTDKIQRMISTICVVAAIVSVMFFPVPASCETLRFVFLADSRGTEATGLEHPIHTEVLVPIIQAIKNLHPQPKFVIFGGDMSYRGYIDTKDIPNEWTFQMWKDLFKDLEDAGIRLYTAIGNHELYRHDNKHPENGFALENQEKYQEVFSENPTNGPQRYTPSYDHLVYSFTSRGGDAFFAVLDPYFLTTDEPVTNLGGHIDDVQLKWLAQQVAKTKATHKFLFIHTPYYYVNGQDPEEVSAADDSLTKLWTILDNNRFDFYACGHQHLYSRKTIDGCVPPDPQTTPPRPPWRHDVVQLLNGTSGAGPDTTSPVVNPKRWHIHQDPNTYYFSVIDIHGSEVKVTSYGGNTEAEEYKEIDEFTIYPWQHYEWWYPWYDRCPSPR